MHDVSIADTLCDLQLSFQQFSYMNYCKPPV